MAWSTSASPPMVATPSCIISIVMFLGGRGLLGVQSGRRPLAGAGSAGHISHQQGSPALHFLPAGGATVCFRSVCRELGYHFPLLSMQPRKPFCALCTTS